MYFYSQYNSFLLVHAGFCSLSLCVSKNERFCQPLCMWRVPMSVQVWDPCTLCLPLACSPCCYWEGLPHHARSSPFWIDWLNHEAFGSRLSPNTMPNFLHGCWSFQLRPSSFHMFLPTGPSPQAFSLLCGINSGWDSVCLLRICSSLSVCKVSSTACYFRWVHPFSFHCSLT